MSDNNQNEIPATIEFQKEILEIQEEYRTALRERVHPDKSFDNNLFFNCMYFTDKCHSIYIIKIHQLIEKVTKKHQESYLKHIDLNTYKRFNDLISETITNLHDILENK
jgi:hypothetical protein